LQTKKKMTAAVAHHDLELDLGGGSSSKQSQGVMDLMTKSLQTCSFEETAAHHHQQQSQQQQDDASEVSSSVSPAIDELPDEVLLQVAAHLGVRALGAFAQVDRRLRAIAEVRLVLLTCTCGRRGWPTHDLTCPCVCVCVWQDDALWRDMFVARFGFLPTAVATSWKLAYSDYGACLSLLS
jgi:hypothetical protein